LKISLLNLLENEIPFRIGIVIGKSGIIDNDIKHQLRESIGFYELTFHRVNLSSEQGGFGAFYYNYL
jgi:hypothetical protein